MPITKSAKKALRQNIRRRAKNLVTKNRIQAEIKKFRRLLAAKNTAEAKNQLSIVYKSLDKSAKTSVIKRNAANRKKSRLAKALARLK